MQDSFNNFFLKKLGERKAVSKGNYRIFARDEEIDEQTALEMLNYQEVGWALPYGGHQFAQYNPDLGDGRSLLIGQAKEHSKYLYLKGDVRTSFTKYGDGNLPFDSAYREWCVSRQLDVVMPGLNQKCLVLGQNRDNPKLGRLVIARHTFLRVGTLQYIKDQKPELLNLAILHLKQQANNKDWTNGQLLEFIRASFKRTANLCYKHMFVHGSLSTDNVDPFGHLLDYGRSYFYNPEAEEKAKEFDPNGWYSYQNQDKALNFTLNQLEEIIT